MAIDPSIALGIKPVQIESPVNQMAQLYQLQNAAQSNQLNQLQLSEAQRKIEDRNRLRATLGGFAPDMSVDQQVNALARAGYLDEAKALAESASKVGKEKRESEKALTDTQAAQIKFHRDLLPAVRDQGSYDNWYASATKAIPELTSILPKQYSPENVINLAMTADKLIESQKPHFVNQENVMVNGVPTSRVLSIVGAGPAKTIEGSSGATYNKPAASVNVNMPPQEKEFEKELGTQQAKTVIANKAKAEDAAQILATNQVAKNLLDKGVITGVGAEFFTKLNQGLSQAGIDFGYGDAAKNSQAYGGLMATNTAKLIKNFGAGTGLSDADRQYAKQAAAGDITIDEKAIRKLIDINNRAAQNVIKLHNKNVENIKTNIPLSVNPEDYSAGIPEARTGAADNRKPLKDIFGH